MKSMESTQPQEEPQGTKKSSMFENAIGMAALAGVAVSPQVSAQETAIPVTQTTPQTTVSAEIAPTRQTTRERVSEQERERLGEFFSLEQYTYNTLYTRLTNREVMFTDEQGLIIGEPIRLDPIIDRTADGQVLVTSPGQLDQRGVPVGNISPQWLNRTRTRICQEYNVPCNLADSKPRVRSTIRLIRDAKSYLTPGPERPNTFIDVIRQMSARQVPIQAEQVTYAEYISSHFGNNVELPATLENELSHIVPGLVAQESQYNNSARSPVGARGMFQIMPATQRQMGYGAEQLSFPRQVDLSGEYFESAYRSEEHTSELQSPC